MISKLDVEGFKQRFKQMYPEDDKGHYATFLNPVLDAISSQDVFQKIEDQKLVLKKYQDIDDALKNALKKTLVDIKKKLKNVNSSEADPARYPHLVAAVVSLPEGKVLPVRLFYPLELLSLELDFEKDLEERHKSKNSETLQKFKKNYLYPMLDSLAKLDEPKDSSDEEASKSRSNFFKYIIAFEANRKNLHEEKYTEDPKAIKAFDESLCRLKKNIRTQIKTTRPNLYRQIAGGLEEERHKQARFENAVAHFMRVIHLLSTPMTFLLSSVLFIFKCCAWEYVNNQDNLDIYNKAGVKPGCGDYLVDVVQIKTNPELNGNSFCVIDNRYHFLAPKQTIRHFGEDIVERNAKDAKENLPVRQLMA